MNLILTQSNQRSSNIRWEPFATSTPLKVVPDNINFERNLQKQLKLSTDSHDLIKKLQKENSSINDTEKKASDLKQLVTKLLIKNKSCANIEISSSSDEDSASEKRPVIKLGLKSQGNSLLKNKKSEDQGVEVVRNKNTTDNNQILTCKESNKCSYKNCKQNYNHVHNSKKKKQDVNLVLDNSSSGEENKIFDKVNPGNSTNNTKLEREDDKNFKHLSSCKFKINKSENKRKTCSCLKKDSETLKSFQKLNFEDKVIRKRKCKSIEQASSSLKISESKKPKNKSLTQFKNGVKKNAVTSFLTSESKTNISHQLFSESKEQELINTLNLTTEEMIETVESKASFIKNKPSRSSLNLPHPSNHSGLIENQNKHRPKKCNLKKYQLTKTFCNKLLPAADSKNQFELERNSKVFKESNEPTQESQKKTENILCKDFVEKDSEKDDLNHKKTGRKESKKMIHKIRKERKTFAVKRAANNIKTGNSDANGAKCSLDSENANKNKKLSEPSQVAEGEETTATEKQVFKLINDISYNEDGTGCSAAECWNVNTFKCGVFRLKIKSQMNCRTLHSNSHLGGVLIEGNLRMKIGSKEHDLQQGDMAFVPPLTDWQATNIGECESVFYYWCGRFKI